MAKGGLTPDPLPGLTDSRLTSAGWVHSGGGDSVAAARNPMLFFFTRATRVARMGPSAVLRRPEWTNECRCGGSLDNQAFFA